MGETAVLSQARGEQEAGYSGGSVLWCAEVPASSLLSARTFEDYEERVSAHTGSFYEVIANPSPEHQTPI